MGAYEKKFESFIHVKFCFAWMFYFHTAVFYEHSLNLYDDQSHKIVMKKELYNVKIFFLIYFAGFWNHKRSNLCFIHSCLLSPVLLPGNHLIMEFWYCASIFLYSLVMLVPILYQAKSLFEIFFHVLEIKVTETDFPLHCHERPLFFILPLSFKIWIGSTLDCISQLLPWIFVTQFLPISLPQAWSQIYIVIIFLNKWLEIEKLKCIVIFTCDTWCYTAMIHQLHSFVFLINQHKSNIFKMKRVAIFFF